MIPFFQYEFVKIGGVPFTSFELCNYLGFLVIAFLFLKTVKKIGRLYWQDYLATIITFFIGVFGSRLFYCFQFPKYFLSRPEEIFYLRGGGLMIFGGLVGIYLWIFIYVRFIRNSKEILNNWFDTFSLYFPIFLAIKRVGCSLMNDHQGAETSLPWGIVWPDGVIRHPVAEYLIISNLIIFLILRYLKPRLKQPGQLTFTFLGLWLSSRFFLDFTRSAGTPLSDPHFWIFSTTQWLSLFTLLSLAVIILIKKPKFIFSTCQVVKI